MIVRQQASAKYAIAVGLIAIIGFLGLMGTAHAEMSELETFIRTRIEIGESMAAFMRERSGMGRSMEDYEQMTEEINAMVAGILGSYGLTIETYQARGPQVFSDEAAVSTFLKTHPDLKERYELLSLNHPGGGHGGP